MTIGDVLAVVAGIMATGVTMWALLIVMALVFAGRVGRAQTLLLTRPLRATGVGLILALTAGLFGLALVNQPNGLLKLFGWILLVGLLQIGALGGGGLALLIGGRIREGAPDLSPFGALGRGAGFLVAASLTPAVGWFLIWPLSTLAALGSGCLALLPPRRRPEPSAATATAPASIPPVAASDVGAVS